MAKIRATGISTPLIARTIGLAKGDNGALCTSDNIKMWSYHKPFNRVPENGDYSDKYVYTMEERDLAISHYGLMYIPIRKGTYQGALSSLEGYGYLTAGISPGSYTEKELKEKFKYRYEVFDDVNSGQGQIDANGVFYGKPSPRADGKIEYTLQHNDGSETKVSYRSRARQSDFREYDHAAIAPVISTGLQKILDENGTLSEYKIVIRVRRTPANSTYGGLTVDNWVPYYDIFKNLDDKANTWKLGVGLYDTFGFNLYTFLKPDGVTGSLDQTNAFVSLGSPASDFSDFTFRMSAADFNVLMGQHEWGFFSVIPILVKNPTVGYTDNTNKLNPVFANIANNHMLMFHDCYWPLIQINKGNVAWYGAEKDAQGIYHNISHSIEGRKLYQNFSYTPDDGTTVRFPITYIPMPAGAEESWYYPTDPTDFDRTRKLAPYFGNKEFMLRAADKLKDTVTTNKRTVLIGDYYVGKYYLTPSWIAYEQDKMLYLPLIDVKVKVGYSFAEYVVDAHIALVKHPILKDANGIDRLHKDETHICLIVNYPYGDLGKEVMSIYKLPTDVNVKTVVFQNLVNADTNEIEGLRVRGINIQWSKGWSGTVKDNNENLSNITAADAFWYRDIDIENPLPSVRIENGLVPYIPTSVETNAYVFSNKYDVNANPYEDPGAAADYVPPFVLQESAYHPYVHISNGGVNDDIPEMLSFGSTEWEPVTE